MHMHTNASATSSPTASRRSSISMMNPFSTPGTHTNTHTDVCSHIRRFYSSLYSVSSSCIVYRCSAMRINLTCLIMHLFTPLLSSPLLFPPLLSPSLLSPHLLSAHLLSAHLLSSPPSVSFSRICICICICICVCICVCKGADLAAHSPLPAVATQETERGPPSPWTTKEQSKYWPTQKKGYLKQRNN